MRIVFDQGTPAPLRLELRGHSVATAFELGWSDLKNGDLLRSAESAFELLISTDKNLGYQQNISGRSISILVLPTTNWPEIRLHATEVVAAVEAMKPGEYRQLQWTE